MRRDVVELRRFYAGPLGHAVREMVGRKVDEAWGYATGMDVLALGYATPFLDGLPLSRTRVFAMTSSSVRAKFSSTMMASAPESLSWCSSSRAVYSGFTLTTMYPARSTAAMATMY